MLLTTTTEFLYKKYGIDKTIEMIAEAGFDAIDYSAFEMLKDEDPINQPDYKEYALRVRKKAESCGVRFVQAHAPFPSSRDDEVYNTSIKEKIIRCMEACAIMGVEIIVVHPIQHLSYMNNVETLFDMNMEFYKDLVTYAEKFNIRVATENMFQYDANRDVMRDSTCASPEEFCRYIDTVNSPYLTGCLDIGHCGLCGREPYDMIEYMGAERISCLHIHDNDYKKDYHTLPCTMKQDWNKICKALADIGYNGNFTYEADGFFRNYDEEFYPTVLKFMHDTGRYLINKINSYR